MRNELDHLTATDIDTIPAGRELDAMVLVYLCGWHWRLHNDIGKCSLVPPADEPNGWEKSPKAVPEFEAKLFSRLDHWPSDSEKFSDWDRACINRHPNGYNFYAPLVSTDTKQAFIAMRSWEGDIDLRRQNGQWRCELFQPSHEWEAWAETAELAFCRAILKTIRYPAFGKQVNP